MHTSPIRLRTGTFDPDSGEVRLAHGAVQLTPCEARLLVYLAAHPDRVVPVRELLQAVWGYAPGVRSRTVYVTVGRLRAKIGDDDGGPRQIVAVRAAGYRFVPLGASAREFRGAVWFCDLEGAADPDSVSEIVARTLDLPVAGAATPDGVARALERQGPGLAVLERAGPALRVLQTLVGRWRAAAPHFRFVVTAEGP